MELEKQNKNATTPTSASKPKLKSMGRGQIKVTTPSAKGSVQKRSLMGEFKEEQKAKNVFSPKNAILEEQSRRKTMGGMTVNAGVTIPSVNVEVHEEQLRRKKVGGNAVGGINIKAAQEFAGYQVEEEEVFQSNAPRVSISSKSSKGYNPNQERVDKIRATAT